MIKPVVTLLMDEIVNLRHELASIQADAALGAMVRRMPIGYELVRWTDEDKEYWSVYTGQYTPDAEDYDTPEEALKAAK